jgi:hypothetical protein
MPDRPPPAACQRGDFVLFELPSGYLISVVIERRGSGRP